MSVPRLGRLLLLTSALAFLPSLTRAARVKNVPAGATVHQKESLGSAESLTTKYNAHRRRAKAWYVDPNSGNQTSEDGTWDMCNPSSTATNQPDITTKPAPSTFRGKATCGTCQTALKAMMLSMDVPFDIVGGGRGCTTNCGYTNVFPDVTGYCWAADNGAWHSYADAETACDADVTCKALNCKKDNGATVDCTNYKTSSNLCCQLSSKCGVSGKHDPGRWNRHNKVHGSPADQARVWNWALMQVCEHASQHNEPDLFQRVLAPSENAVSFYPRTFPTYGQTRWTAKAAYVRGTSFGCGGGNTYYSHTYILKLTKCVYNALLGGANTAGKPTGTVLVTSAYPACIDECNNRTDCTAIRWSGVDDTGPWTANSFAAAATHGHYDLSTCAPGGNLGGNLTIEECATKCLEHGSEAQCVGFEHTEDTGCHIFDCKTGWADNATYSYYERTVFPNQCDLLSTATASTTIGAGTWEWKTKTESSCTNQMICTTAAVEQANPWNGPVASVWKAGQTIPSAFSSACGSDAQIDNFGTEDACSIH